MIINITDKIFSNKILDIISNDFDMDFKSMQKEKMEKMVIPAFFKTAFHCPNCGAYAKQEWLWAAGKRDSKGSYYYDVDDNISFARCEHCNKYSIWREKKMIFPYSGTVPLPNKDMPEDVKMDYNEARNIVELSPRGASALLRLAIQKLCKYFGEPGMNLNNNIANLVKKGLPPKMQKALDSVRVIGNNAVHPGVIDIKDDIETAKKLFAFINIITDVMITQPNEIDKFYNEKIPDAIKGQINKRDGK